MKKSMGLICLIVLLTSSFTVNAKEVSVNTQTEQLLEVDLVHGTEKVVDLPSTESCSDICDTAASDIMLSRSVIGTDDRTQISNTTVHPYYGIAYLSITMEDGKTYRGTGFMISPNTMLTAGHCLKEKTTKAKSIEVYPGRNGNSKPVSGFVTKYYVDTKYTGSEAEWDYGIMVLNSNIGNTTGWFGLHGTTGSSLGTSSVRVTGYPADKSGYNMWTCAGTVSNITTNRFMHTADTYGGESGSPTYFYNGNYGYQAVGIHTHGGNYSRRVTNSLVTWLKDNGLVN